MADIKMPRTPPDAYDPKRPANALLLAHARELEKAVAAKGRRVKRQKPRTEEQVAFYIRHLNRALYQQVLLPKMRRRPLDVPLPGSAPARSPAGKKRKTRKTAKKKGTRKRS